MKIAIALRMALVVAAAVTFLHQNATAATIVYGAASGFSVLAGTGISSTGGTMIGRDVGVSPYAGTSITGLLPGQVSGTIYAVDDSGPAGSAGNNKTLVDNAMIAFGAAYTAAAGETPTPPNLGLQLAGQTLTPGVYTFDPGTVLLDGTLTLINPNHVMNPVWIFQAKSDLTTGVNSEVVLNDGVVPCDVLWRVPTQATLGSGSTFVGTIMAGTSIVMDHGATLDGRAWADAAVTLDDNTITGLPCTSLGGTEGTTVPDTGSTLLLLGSGLATLLAFRQRFFSPA
jgi:hypothetical protein